MRRLRYRLPVNGLRAAAERREIHERQILDHLEANRSVTQRTLASELGIALGLTNLLMRRLVRKGWVRIRPVSARRMMYLITPAGVTAKAKMTRRYFLSSLDFYRDTRGWTRARLGAIATELDAAWCAPPHRVVFYGAGDVAEVAFVCLREAGLELAGVVNDGVSTPFFAAHTHTPADLDGQALSGEPFAGLIVMALQDEARVRATLEERQVPAASVFWL